MVARKYSNVSKTMTLVSSINASVTSITVSDATGLPITFPYSLALDYEQAALEIVLVTAAAGNNLTIARGQEDTAAAPHSAGATIVHAATALDFQQSQDHINASQNVHGIGGSSSVVGTQTSQTLTNKVMSGVDNDFEDIPLTSIDPIGVGDVVGNWPIDTRSTGNLPIDTRTSGNLPIDTRTSGNLPGSRVTGSLATATLPAGNITGTISQSQLGAFNNVTIGQSNAAQPALTLTPNASATEDLFKASVPVGFTGARLKRDTSSTSGNFVRFDTEADAELMSATRDGKWRGQDFVIIGSPDRSVSTELTNLKDPPRLTLRRAAAQSIPVTTNTAILFDTTVGNRRSWAYNSGTGVMTPPVSGHYMVEVALDYSSGVSGTAIIDCYIAKNGAQFVKINREQISPTLGSCAWAGGASVDLITSDTINIYVWQNQTSAGSITGNVTVWYIGPS